MGKVNKEIATAQELIKDVVFDTPPLDISVHKEPKKKGGLCIAALINNTILFEKDVDEKDFPIVTLYGVEKVLSEQTGLSNLEKSLEFHVQASHIHQILKELNHSNFTDNGSVKVEIDKILLSDEGLLIYSTVAYFNKVVTYQFLLTSMELDEDLFEYKANIIQEYDSEEMAERITSVSCSANLSTISLILGRNYHIILKRKDILDDWGDVNDFSFETSLKNYTRFTNGEDKRTLYSSVNKEGNRIIVSDRDEIIKLRNNTNISNLGTINSLVYDYKKSKWMVDDRFYELNVNIRNIGEHVDINDNGDRVVTTAIYNPINTETVKDVIYVLARNARGKWKKLARGVIGNSVSKICLANDDNIILAETIVKIDEDKTIKKLNCLFREGDSLANNELVDNEGVYKQICSLDKHEYVGFIKFRSSIWDCVVLAKNLTTNKYHLFKLNCLIVNEHNKEQLESLEISV